MEYNNKIYNLDFKDTIDNLSFIQTGNPAGIYYNEDKSLCAIYSNYGSITWNGKYVSPFLKQYISFNNKLTLYDTKTLSILGVLGLKNYPINDISFHPNKKTISVATGSYDGGYLYTGNLLIWNYENNTSYYVLDESVEVSKCRFNDEGNKIYTWISTENSEYWSGAIREYEIHEYWKAPLSLGSLKKIGEKKVSNYERYPSKNIDTIKSELSLLAKTAGKTYEGRSSVFDVKWLNKEELVNVTANSALERWNKNGNRLLHITEPDNGVQIFLSKDKNYAYIHSFYSYETEDYIQNKESSILKIDLRNGSIIKKESRNFQLFLHNNNELDHFFVRDCTMHPKDEGIKSFILNKDEIDDFCKYLGAHNFTNYVEGYDSTGIYFIQDLPVGLNYNDLDFAPYKNSPYNKVYRMDILTKEVKPLFHLDWYENRKGFIMGNGGLYCKDDLGESLIIASTYFNAYITEYQKNRASLTRRNIDTGKLLWINVFESQVTTLKYMSNHKVIVFALAEGKIGVMSSETGKLYIMQDVIIDGATTVILSLDCIENQIAAGTVDGRILYYELNINDSKLQSTL